MCERSPLPVSVKTRLGLESPDEYERILELYCRMPLAELIVHPRVQRDGYDGKPRREFYGETLERVPFPVAYNGDVFSSEDMGELLAAYPGTRHVMLGRGVLMNPALPREIAGGAPLAMEELSRFHDDLYAAYVAEMGGNAVFRMKEWWSYAKHSFADPAAVWRLIRKATYPCSRSRLAARDGHADDGGDDGRQHPAQADIGEGQQVARQRKAGRDRVSQGAGHAQDGDHARDPGPDARGGVACAVRHAHDDQHDRDGVERAQ